MQWKPEASEVAVEDKRKRNAILRNMQMLELVPTYPGRITVTDLHNLLTGLGYQVSKRTVQRDLYSLSEWAGLFSEKDDNGNVWFRDRGSRQQSVITPVEAFLLLTYENESAILIPEKFADKYSERLAMAKALFSGKQELASWSAKVAIIRGNYPVRHRLSHLPDSIRQTIYQALLSEEKISIDYCAAGYSNSTTLTVNPLGLIIRDDSHYLVATKTSSPEKPLLFLMHRISGASLTYEAITPPSGFTLRDYADANPSGWLLASGHESVCLHVKGYALDNLRRNHLGENQAVTQRSEGWFEARFEVQPTYDLIAWILKFGADVKVESPAGLKEKVIEILNRSIKQYAE